MSLQRICESRYGLVGCSLRPLAGGISDHTYAVEQVGAEPLVLRVERPETNDLPVQEQVLLWLETMSYPAPRIVRALDGSPIVYHEGMKLVLTSFIAGALVESGANTPAGLHAMGRSIGRLHALGPLRDDLPGAQFMPGNAVGWAQERLATIAGQVPANWRYRFDEMLQSLAATPPLTEVPACLIHNDCHPGNAVYRADGEVVLIDWDGAGLGAAMLDLGFFLIAADTYTEDVPSVGDSATRVSAIVDGYREYRLPTTAELDHLADAIRFRVTFINAMLFAYRIEHGEFEQISTSWWNGGAQAEALAARARHRFNEYL